MSAAEQGNAEELPEKTEWIWHDGEIVPCGPETARDQHDVAARDRPAEGVRHVRRIVPHGGLEAALDVVVEETLREKCLVRVDDLATQDLVPDGCGGSESGCTQQPTPRPLSVYLSGEQNALRQLAG